MIFGMKSKTYTLHPFAVRIENAVWEHLYLDNLFTKWSPGLKEESDVHYFWIKKVFFLSNGCAQGINFKPTWREWKPESNPSAAWIMENANCYSCNTVTSSILHYAPSLSLFPFLLLCFPLHPLITLPTSCPSPLPPVLTRSLTPLSPFTPLPTSVFLCDCWMERNPIFCPVFAK